MWECWLSISQILVCFHCTQSLANITTWKLIENLIHLLFWGFPDSSVGKESTCNAGDPGWILRSGRPAAEGIGWLPTPVFLGFPCGSAGKEPTCNAGDPGWIPGSGRSPGEWIVYPLQYSCLENPVNRGAWQVTVHWVAESEHE